MSAFGGSSPIVGQLREAEDRDIYYVCTRSPDLCKVKHSLTDVDGIDLNFNVGFDRW